MYTFNNLHTSVLLKKNQFRIYTKFNEKGSISNLVFKTGKRYQSELVTDVICILVIIISVLFIWFFKDTLIWLYNFVKIE